jgi:hypothetical protein
MTLTDCINKIKKLIKDDLSYLTEDDLNLCLDNALTKLSKDRPMIQNVVINGNKSSDFNFPSDWLEEISFIQPIEYPFDDAIPEFLEEEESIIYQNNNSKMIQFLKTKILSSELFKIFYAIPYKLTEEQNIAPNKLTKVLFMFHHTIPTRY